MNILAYIKAELVVGLASAIFLALAAVICLLISKIKEHKEAEGWLYIMAAIISTFISVARGIVNLSHMHDVEDTINYALISIFLTIGLFKIYNHEQKLYSKFSWIVEELPQLSMLTDQSGLAVYANSRWEEIFGSNKSAALGHGWLKFVHHDDLPKLVDWLDTSLKYGFTNQVDAISKLEIRFFIQNQPRWFQLKIRPVRGEDKKIVCWLLQAVDIDEYRKIWKHPELP